jgi:glycosyltransferase involved in cell wall biosynthesis/LmbE family N-acetylglucosaminyl deacetylase
MTGRPPAMRISVIMPCRNAGPWIAAALSSIGRQEYPAHETIVIDDDSTDDSIAQITNAGLAVKLLRVQAGNAAIARNAGIEQATGDWIAFLDADDIWYSNHLARAVKLLSNTNDVAFMADHDWIGLADERKEMPAEAACKLLASRSGMNLDDFIEIVQSGFHFGHSTVLYRRDRLRDVGMFDPSQKRRHDIDLWLRMVSDKTWTYDINKQAGYREDTPGSISRDEAECDYFYLRALVKNLNPEQPQRYRQHLARHARRAMGIAFVDGSPEHLGRIKKLSWPHLSTAYRFFYSLTALYPDLARYLVKAKRQIWRSGGGSQKISLRKRLLRGWISAAASILGLVLVIPRQRAYRRLLSYDPEQDCVAGFSGPAIEILNVRCHKHGFFLPDLKPDVTSAFLELDVRASAAGGFFDPAIEIETSGFRDTQFLERGVRGVRFINLTRLLGTSHSSNRWIGLHGRHVGWRTDSARLHTSRVELSASERVLVIAPHPDDAEIAAFGVYADTEAVVVTLTGGDQSDRYRDRRAMAMPQETIAKLRVLDSITVPRFGGVAPENAINLCFPDSRLADMHARQDHDFREAIGRPPTFADLRRLNLSSLVGPDSACTWKGLVSDLTKVIASAKATTIVAPHPRLDSHLDHVFTTVAVCEALELLGLKEGRLFFYCIHPRRTELWPFGPLGTGVTLPPMWVEDGAGATQFYSHVVSTDRQREKFLALEAMHDIREMELPDSMPLLRAISRLRGELRGLIYGTDRIPTSYLRRAVRPDEIFFVMSFAEATAYTRRLLEQKPRANTATASPASAPDPL